MKKVIKQVLGVDVSQKELVVCLGRMYDDCTTELYAYKTFSNTEEAFLTLLVWVKKLTDQHIPVCYVMEATGVYHERFAYFLKDQGLKVSIVLPNKISNYARSLVIKTITDKTASEAITQFGLERSLDGWEKPSPIFKRMRQLTRERDQIVLERTMVKNQLHAELAEVTCNESSLKRINRRIEFLNNQEKEIIAELSAVIKDNKSIDDSVQLMCSIPGIGVLTAATILAETNGFEQIRNKRQLASYAGLDVKEKQSGTSVKDTPKISKRGNKSLRKAMHLPALAAIRHEEHFKTIFSRLVSRHGIKRKAAVAIQRKLLELTFTLFKTKKKYDKKYWENQVISTPAAESPKKVLTEVEKN